MKNYLVLSLIITIFFVLALNLKVGDMKSFYEPSGIFAENGSINMVSAIVLDYRIYDTFFEILVFTVAIIGISEFIGKIPTVAPDDQQIKYDTPIIKVITPIIFQIIVLISLYIAITGHIAPGGGFAAGTILGTGFLAVSLVRPTDEIENLFVKSKIEKLKMLVPLFIIIYGLLGYVWGDSIFSNFHLKGSPGELASGGSAILLNFLIYFEVFGGSWTILYRFLKHRGLL
ncbi:MULTISPECIES: MnhB domain-containing protein [Petrotoga]|uniref:Multisubunit sodium/proton antiporter MrpB subunit n=2 Tax=Petrotoga sibirica TaxID=156202 RepID=A0A4R8EHK1_9BACT|nr:MULTISPECIES: MnhB domain-containing protein [Petrotoga]POZ88480.1 hypothetical protein AA80_05665 [Petrotoga sibirica DSM 13575]POZ91376.1 hypothetical protein AD60_03000 [Petrotoga sp. SL27]TDX11096.1 multisubunit sodium/proton antiporter MrpB subunit [Petrotoga sibirica]